jgi:hypothetical protein
MNESLREIYFRPHSDKWTSRDLVQKFAQAIFFRETRKGSPANDGIHKLHDFADEYLILAALIVKLETGTCDI